MPDLETLLGEFIEAHLAGRRPDAWSFLDRADEADKKELEDLIDAYYVDAPPQPWSQAEFERWGGPVMVADLTSALQSGSGLWPSLLPRLRDRARIKRQTLVEQLAERLGYPERANKVAAYYHQMEQGSLGSDWVSPKVTDALGDILGTSGSWLAKVGAPLGDMGIDDPGKGTVYARHAIPAPGYDAMESQAITELDDEEWDEIDELFRGGGD